MCGRYSLTLEAPDIIEQFLIDEFLVNDWQPRYNIAPSQLVLGAVEHNGKRRAGYFHWGYIPTWVKEPQSWKPLINARAETLHEKSSFKHLLNKKRCVLFADSFYEWKRMENDKQPIRFLRKNHQPFAFAALWDHVEVGSEKKATCTIITTKPNSTVRSVHDRMPVILKQEQLSFWLDPQQDYEQVQSHLTAFPSAEMECYPVSSMLNSPKADTPSLIERLC